MPPTPYHGNETLYPTSIKHFDPPCEWDLGKPNLFPMLLNHTISTVAYNSPLPISLEIAPI